MLREFDSYRITLTDEPFESSQFDQPLKTATICFLDDTQNIISEVIVGCINKSLFYTLLDKKQPIDLENYYLQDISLNDYRQHSNSDTAIQLPDLKFTNCFFQSSKLSEIDFSHSIFKQISFHGSLFLSNVSFVGSLFKGDDASFDYCLFCGESVNFNDTRFENIHISFKNAIFRVKDKKFENIYFGTGNKIFQNTEFGNGDISFYNTNFGAGLLSFKVARFGKGRKNFDHTHYSNDEVIFERVSFGDGNISFKSAKFDKSRIDFTRSIFGEGQRIFVNTEFGTGSVSFVNTTFGNGKTSFRSAIFNGETADFHYAVFGNGDIVFDRTNFGNTYVDFRSVRFNESHISFDRTVFGHRDIDFEASECSGSLKFEYAEFRKGKLNFHMAEFEKANVTFEHINFNNDIVNFNLARVKILTMKSCEFNKYFDLRVARCEKLDFTESIIRDIVDINPYENYFNVEKIDFSGVILLGRIYLDWKSSNISKKIHSLDLDYRNKCEQFRMLKQNYYTIGNYEYEDMAYIDFKRTEMIADLKESKRDKPYTAPFSYIKYGFKWLILDKTGRFATNPVRVLLSMFFIYLLFSIIYLLLIHFTHSSISTAISNPEIISTLGLSFYYSGVTFFTIGYGDYFPEGYIRWISIIEGFLGVFMMSYLAVAFVRKILR